MGTDKSSFVCQNELILENIFSNLPCKSLLPLRLVCRLWKDQADKQIPKTFDLRFGSNKYSRNPLRNLSKDLQMLEEFNLTRIIIDWPWDEDGTNGNLQTALLYFSLGKLGNQIQHLTILDLRLDIEIHYDLFKNLLSSFPNLKKLEVQLASTAFLRFDKVFHIPSVRIQNFDHHILNPQEMVLQILKIFPGLETNFTYYPMDHWLLSQRERVTLPLKEIKVMEEDIFYNDAFPESWNPILNILKNMESSSLPLLTTMRFEYFKYIGYTASAITKVLENFSSTLRKVVIFPDQETIVESGVVFNIPPLPVLEELILYAPQCCKNGGQTKYSYNLGREMGKGFPKLGILSLDYHTKPAVIHHFPQFCAILESVVPTGNSDVELFPFKSIKVANFCVPEDWIGEEECVEWGKQFLEGYNKLYGNANRGFIQKFVEWLK